MKYTTQHISDMISCAESKLAAASTVAWRRSNFGLYLLTDSLCHIYQLKLYLFLLRRYMNIPEYQNATTEEDLSHMFDRIIRMPYPCDLSVEQPLEVAENQPPSVNAGADQTLSLGATSALLAGTASDPEGQPLTIQWTKVSGGNVTINSPGSLITSITNMQTGAYVFRLTVTDDKGASRSDDVSITIPTALDTIYYGLTAPSGDLATFIESGNLFTANGALDVSVPWYLSQSQPEICWAAIPNRTTAHNKNKWYIDVINQGNIGAPTDLFAAPVTVMINTVEYLFWQTNYQTQFMAACLLKKV